MLMTFLVFFLTGQAKADCGVFKPAQSLDQLNKLIKQNTAKKIFSNREGEFYLHVQEDCCMAGLVATYASVYQKTDDKIIVHPICAANSMGGIKITSEGQVLTITKIAACGSGSNDECDTLLAERQAELDTHPTRLQWREGQFVNLNNRSREDQLKRELKGAFSKDRRDRVLSLARELMNQWQLKDVKRKDQLTIDVLRYQVKRSLQINRKGNPQAAAEELRDTKSKFPVSMASSCGAMKNRQKITLENDIGFVFEQTGMLDDAERYLECVKKRDPGRIVVYLNLCDLYHKRMLDRQEYLLDAKRYLKLAKENGRKYVKMMRAKKLDEKIPPRVFEILQMSR